MMKSKSVRLFTLKYSLRRPLSGALISQSDDCNMCGCRRLLLPPLSKRKCKGRSQRKIGKQWNCTSRPFHKDCWNRCIEQEQQRQWESGKRNERKSKNGAKTVKHILLVRFFFLSFIYLIFSLATSIWSRVRTNWQYLLMPMKNKCYYSLLPLWKDGDVLDDFASAKSR